jgi:hypothetical protein
MEQGMLNIVQAILQRKNLISHSSLSNRSTWLGTSPPFHLMKETNPVFEICLKSLKMLDNVHNNGHINFNIPPSEIFRLSLKKKQFSMDCGSKT